ncbi:MAG: aminotransferase class III-fold pyridoxal phosphate-dependent enzyme [Bacteroidota bacterium]
MDTKELLRKHFDISATRLTGMEGYDSDNTRVETEDQRWVLKRYSAAEGLLPFLRAETAFLYHLHQKGIAELPTPQVDRAGESLTILDTGEILRLLSFVEGEFLAEVPHDAGLLRSFGRWVGKLSKAGEGFWHPGVEAQRSAWDLQHCLMSRELVSHIPAQDRAVVAYWYQQWEVHVQPHWYQLRRQVIHGDANDWNVLVQDGEVSGIIDFGDMCYSPVVHELAIALTYALFKKDDPLAAAKPVIQGYQAEFELTEQEMDLLPWLIAARLCVSVCQSAAKRASEVGTAYHSVSEQDAWQLLRQWTRLSPRLMQQVFREAAGVPPIKKWEAESLLARRSRYSGGNLGLSYRKPLHLNSGAFQYLFGANGETYLDAYNNIAHIGHAHPRVVSAVSRQMSQLNTNTRYLYEAHTEYAERLLAHFPARLNRLFLVNSGSEATDLALRMVRAYTDTTDMLVLEHGYHGHSQAGIEVSHYKFAGKGGGGRTANIHPLPIPSLQGPEPDLARILETISRPIAAFIGESVVGCGGQVFLPPEYVQQVYAWVRNQGGLCIADEVQTGFMRLGESHFWGFERVGVVPDVVILGKSMGNGHPIAGVVCTEEVAEAFDNGMEFFSSYGGNPVSCAAGLAVLEVLESQGLSINQTGAHLCQELASLAAEFPELLGEVRGAGLFVGLEWVKEGTTPYPELATYLKEYLYQHRILTGTDGPFHNVIKLKPPLCFDQQNADQVVEALQNGLRSWKS